MTIVTKPNTEKKIANEKADKTLKVPAPPLVSNFSIMVISCFFLLLFYFILFNNELHKDNISFV